MILNRFKMAEKVYEAVKKIPLDFIAFRAKVLKKVIGLKLKIIIGNFLIEINRFRKIEKGFPN